MPFGQISFAEGLISNTIEPLYMQGPNALGPTEFSVQTLFPDFELIFTRDTKLRNNLFHICPLID
jgi:hypothetical protein